MGDWWRSARVAAAHEFGRRHYRGFAALEVTRRLLPTLAVGVVVGVAGWGAWRLWHWSPRAVTVPSAPAAAPAVPAWVHQWGPTLLAVAVALLLVAVVGWAVRRWGWMAILYLPVEVEHTAVWVVGGVAVLVLGGFGAWWALS